MSVAKEIVLITGANRGIGLESARQLGKLGFKVLVGARDEKAGKEVVARLVSDSQVDAEFVALDVVSESSVAAAAADVTARFGRLDVLVNNAGVVSGNNGGPLTDVDIAKARRDFDVNFFGVVSVTTAFLPLLKQSPLPRIVNISSIIGSHGEHADPTSIIYGLLPWSYTASKAALNMYTQNLAHAFKEAKVNAAHPGWVKTDMGGSNAPLSVEEGVETTVYLATLGADGPTGGFFFKKDRLRW